MPDQEITPKEDPQDETPDESQEEEPKGEFIQEPPERKSTVKDYKTELEREKQMNRLEYQMRKLKEENQKLAEQVGGDYRPPKFEEPEFTDNKIFEDMDKKERAMEVKDYIRENPEYKDYSGVLEKFVNHDAYKNVPVDFIAKALSADRAQSLGAQKALQSQKKAQMSQVGGHPVKPKTDAEKNWLDASNEEFEKELAKVKRSR